MKQWSVEIEIPEPYKRLARKFATAAATYRAMRLHGPANDAEAWNGACEMLVRPLDREAA